MRGADDEDNQMTAARKVTRKQKDIDEESKKIGKRKVLHKTELVYMANLYQSLVDDGLLTCT